MDSFRFPVSTGRLLRRDVPYIFLSPFGCCIQVYCAIFPMRQLIGQFSFDLAKIVLHSSHFIPSLKCNMSSASERSCTNGAVDGCTWVRMMVCMEQMENRCRVDSSPPPIFLALAVQKGGESLVHNFTYRISWKRCHLE